ncbi:MAG: hypothetical protein WAX89_03010 [Alphaproteobacteria bacterium]
MQILSLLLFMLSFMSLAGIPAFIVTLIMLSVWPPAADYLWWASGGVVAWWAVAYFPSLQRNFQPPHNFAYHFMAGVLSPILNGFFKTHKDPKGGLTDALLFTGFGPASVAGIWLAYALLH